LTRALSGGGGSRAAAGIAALVWLTLPSAAQSQAPGYPPVDPRSVVAEYRAEVLERINEHLAAWGDAWANDRAQELTELYWEDALLVAPGGITARGRHEIRSYFDSVLPEHGHIEAFMLDFEASGGMSQVFGNYMLGVRSSAPAGGQLRGPMMTVYIRRGRTWRIRSQIFLDPQSDS